MAERCSPDPSSSRVPVHSALVQKSVTAITNPAGRLSIWMLGKSRALGKWKSAKSWQAACNKSNERFSNGIALKLWRGEVGNVGARRISPWLGPRKDLILLANYEFILSTLVPGPKASPLARRRYAGEV
jgi:hypothetical protein